MQLWSGLKRARTSQLRVKADESTPEADGEKTWSIDEILAEASCSDSLTSFNQLC